MNWLQDQAEKHEFATDYSIFLGSFSNSEAAQNMMSKRNPKFQSSDEDFDKATERVLAERSKVPSENIENITNTPHRRRRRVLNNQE